MNTKFSLKRSHKLYALILLALIFAIPISLSGCGGGGGGSSSSSSPYSNVTELSSSGALIGTYVAGARPVAIAIGSSGNVWVANEG